MKFIFLNIIIAILIWISPNSGKNKLNDVIKAPSANINTALLKNDSNAFANIELTHPLDEAMASKGRNIYYSRCVFCHKLTTETLIGPGWKGVTNRRTNKWMLFTFMHLDNMVDNGLDNIQLMMDDCAVKSQGKNLNFEQARAVLEFIRKNDNKN